MGHHVPPRAFQMVVQSNQGMGEVRKLWQGVRPKSCREDLITYLQPKVGYHVAQRFYIPLL